MFLFKHFVDKGKEFGLKGKEFSLVNQVKMNLQNVLQSKRGTSYFLRNFGLSEVGFRTPEEMITIVTAELRENIRLYEPRVVVSSINDEYDDNGFRIRLMMVVRLRDAPDQLRIVFSLQDRAISIEPIETTPTR